MSCSGLINTTVENNPFVGTWQEAMKMAPGAHSGSVFRNNIFQSKGSVDGNRVLIVQTRNDTTFQNNLFWTPDNSAASKFLWVTDGSYSPNIDFNTWNTSDHVTGNFWGNPNLSALGAITGNVAANQQLTAASVIAIDKGTWQDAPKDDYVSAKRPVGLGIDVGAYEFGGGAIVPPTATSTIVPPTNAPTNTPIPPTNTPTTIPTNVPTNTPT